MRREFHVRFCEGAGGQFPRATRLVVLHRDKAIIEESQRFTQEWLKKMGLELKPSKTRVTHTLERYQDETPGFNFLGFNIRQYPVGKTRSAKDTRGNLLGFKTIIKPSKESVKRHVQKLRETIHKNRSSDQETLIKALNPKIVGWCSYYATVACAATFRVVGHVLFAMLWAWAKRRHPDKGHKWVADKYWRHNDGLGWIFQARGSDLRLRMHTSIHTKRHIKVVGVEAHMTETGSTGALGWEGTQPPLSGWPGSSRSRAGSAKNVDCTFEQAIEWRLIT